MRPHNNYYAGLILAGLGRLQGFRIISLPNGLRRAASIGTREHVRLSSANAKPIEPNKTVELSQ